MCKNFVVRRTNRTIEYESIGSIFIVRERNKEYEHAISSDEASRIHHSALNKAREVRMRKHVDIIMV